MGIAEVLVRLLRIPFWMTQAQYRLARHFSFIPEPGLTRPIRYRGPSLAYRWHRLRTMDGRRRGWLLFWWFWGGVVALSIFGNVIPQ